MVDLLASALDASEPVEVRSNLGAVLIRSPRFGEVWIALDPCMMPKLVAEEATRDDPRPVLLPEDIAMLRARSEDAIAASLEILRAFPGARIRS